MDPREVLAFITPEVHASLKRAVEIGKWPDGTALSREQRELCMQAVIAWESTALPEHERTGYIDRGGKGADDRCEAEPEVIRILRDTIG